MYSAYHIFTYLHRYLSTTPNPTEPSPNLTLDPVLKTAQASNQSLLKRLSLLLPGLVSIGYLSLATQQNVILTLVVGTLPIVSSFISELVILIKERSVLEPNAGHKIMTNFLFACVLLLLLSVAIYQQSEKKDIERLLVDYQAKNKTYHQELASKQKVPILATRPN